MDCNDAKEETKDFTPLIPYPPPLLMKLESVYDRDVNFDAYVDQVL